MNNASTVYWQAERPHSLQGIGRNIIFLFMGAAAITSNVFVLAALYQTRKFEKNNVLIGGLSVGCLITGFGYATAAIRRFYIHLMGIRETSRYMCMISSIHLWCYMVGEKLAFAMIVIISMDRLFAVASSTLYARFNTARIGVLIFFVSTLWTIDYLTAWISTIVDDRSRQFVPADCDDYDVLPKIQYDMHNLFMLSCGYLSIAIYAGAVIIAHWRKRHSMATLHVGFRREIVLLKRVSTVIAGCFFFQSLPISIFLAMHDKSSALSNLLDTWVWSVSSLGIVFLVLVYSLFHPHIRKSIFAILQGGCTCCRSSGGTCRQMLVLSGNELSPLKSSRSQNTQKCCLVIATSAT